MHTTALNLFVPCNECTTDVELVSRGSSHNGSDPQMPHDLDYLGSAQEGGLLESTMQHAHVQHPQQQVCVCFCMLGVRV